jgi:4-amino-4-deoxy-L-arabinose transferase-like glycosyltransferase
VFNGGEVSEWTVRLPSVASALLCLWATVRIGDRVSGNGLVAGWVLLTSYGFQIWAHRGTSDLMSTALVTAAVAAWLEFVETRRGSWALAFWASMALASQAKGLQGFLLPSFAVLLHLTMTRCWSAISSRWHVWGLLVAAWLYLGPFLGSYYVVHDTAGIGLVFLENLTRYLSPFDHRSGSWTLYLVAIPTYFAPWVLYFPAAVLWTIREPRPRWLLATVGAIVLFFFLSGSRREHYILPVLPLLCVWVGEFLSVTERRWESRLLSLLMLGFALVSGASLWQAAPGWMEYLREHARVVAGMSAVCLGVAGLRFWTISIPRVQGVHEISSILALWLWVWWAAVPHLQTEDSDVRRFAAAVRERVAVEGWDTLAFHGAKEARLVFYLHPPSPIKFSDHEDEAARLPEKGVGRVVAVPSDAYHILLPMGRIPHTCIAERHFPWRSSTHLQLRSLIYLDFGARAPN